MPSCWRRSDTPSPSPACSQTQEWCTGGLPALLSNNPLQVLLMQLPVLPCIVSCSRLAGLLARTSIALIHVPRRYRFLLTGLAALCST